MFLLLSESAMNGKTTSHLALLLVGGLITWTVACLLLHGPAILMYIGIQTITSGIFAWEMHRLEKTTRRPAAIRVRSNDR